MSLAVSSTSLESGDGLQALIVALLKTKPASISSCNPSRQFVEDGNENEKPWTEEAK